MEAGRHHYREAIYSAQELKKLELIARAYTYYVREELRFDPLNEELRDAAFRLVGESKSDELRVLAEAQIGRGIPLPSKAIEGPFSHERTQSERVLPTSTKLLS